MGPYSAVASRNHGASAFWAAAPPGRARARHRAGRIRVRARMGRTPVVKEPDPGTVGAGVPGCWGMPTGEYTEPCRRGGRIVRLRRRRVGDVTWTCGDGRIPGTCLLLGT